MVSNAESATERILKTIGTSYFCNSFAKISFFAKSSNDFELKSFLQSTLETYEFQQRKLLLILFEFYHFLKLHLNSL